MKAVLVDWMLVFCTAVIAMGLIQYAKGWLKNLPTWVWGAALPVVIVIVAAAVTYLPPFVLLALLAMSVAQLGYETLFQLLKTFISNLVPKKPPEEAGK